MQFEFNIMYLELVIKVSGVLFVENEYIYGKHFVRLFYQCLALIKCVSVDCFMLENNLARIRANFNLSGSLTSIFNLYKLCSKCRNGNSLLY
jgi:hypothetical protein